MWPYPKIVAHRGGGSLAPENTLAAMACGLSHGYRAVEFDVMLSKDEIPVLMHDSEFGRTVKAIGKVATTPAEELLKMDAGSWFSPAFSDVRVPSYEEVFQFCQKHQIWMNVEIKPAPGFEGVTGEVVAALTQELMRQQGAQALPPLFSSFSYDALRCAQQKAPEIARGLLMDSFEPTWQQSLNTLEAVALHTNHQNLTLEWTKQIKLAGYGLFCYTVNSVERARQILSWGVDGFCTDRIDLIPANFTS